jgi:hypothetical protein
MGMWLVRMNDIYKSCGFNPVEIKKQKLPNTDTADFVSNEIIEYSKTLTNAIKSDNEMNPTDLVMLFMVCAVLFYLQTDRMVFSKYGAEERNSYMDVVSEKLLVTLSNAVEMELKATFEAWNNILEALAPHASRLFAEKGESLEGTLVWEFSKMIDEFGLDGVITHTTTLLAGNAAVDYMKSIAPKIG